VLCRKYNADIAVASFAAEPWEMRGLNDLEAFARIIGIHDAKASLSAIEKKILTNRKRQSPNYIAEGVEQLGS
jgi:RNase P/RNase MRP subunit p30